MRILLVEDDEALAQAVGSDDICADLSYQPPQQWRDAYTQQLRDQNRLQDVTLPHLSTPAFVMQGMVDGVMDSISGAGRSAGARRSNSGLADYRRRGRPRVRVSAWCAAALPAARPRPPRSRPP